MLTVKLICLWLHLLCMLGCFGMVLGSVFSARAHNSETLASDRTLKVAALTLAAGLLAGIATMVVSLRLGPDIPGHYMMVVMVKFVLLLAAGGALGVASNKASSGDAKAARGPRAAALLVLTIASLLGVFLRP